MSFDTGNVTQQWRLFKRQILFYPDCKFSTDQSTDRKKVGVLTTALGHEGIEILGTLFKPDEQPSCDEIIEKFDEYCNPKKNTVFQRSVYFCLAQKPEQSIDMFIFELKKQATLCEFAKEEHDKLLHLTKAVEACKCHEQSQNQVSQIVASSSATLLSVDQLSNKRRPAIGNSVPHCQNCGYSHGTFRPCPAAKASCKRCVTKAVKSVEKQAEEESEQYQIDLLKVYGCRRLDTAAECDTLFEQSYRMLSPHPPLFPTTNVLKPNLAPVFHPLGEITFWCKSHRLNFFIMPDDEENLLGFKTCRCLDLINRACNYNVKFNPDKLQFKKPSVQFLGPVISAQGMKPAYKHVRALVELLIPTDKSAVLRFFEFVKFSARFLPIVSHLTANLRQLTRKDVEFQWTAAYQDEFQHI
ncbi:hypothetical protein V9T40_006994 [Parthenolecanium corni]|uniref:Uncharacterized protein n=1 Tax=Parthenolecanium corni TaxID=536013 RepID=A0AAN9YAD0_9HEMI